MYLLICVAVTVSDPEEVPQLAKRLCVYPVHTPVMELPTSLPGMEEPTYSWKDMTESWVSPAGEPESWTSPEGEPLPSTFPAGEPLPSTSLKSESLPFFSSADFPEPSITPGDEMDGYDFFMEVLESKIPPTSPMSPWSSWADAFEPWASWEDETETSTCLADLIKPSTSPAGLTEPTTSPRPQAAEFPPVCDLHDLLEVSGYWPDSPSVQRTTKELAYLLRDNWKASSSEHGHLNNNCSLKKDVSCK